MLKKLLYMLLCSLSLLAAAPETLPTKPAAPSLPVHPVTPIETPPAMPEMVMDNYEGAFLKMFLTLFGLLVAIFFTVWLIKKFGKRLNSSSAGKGIRILEKKPLSPKTTLYLIEIGNQQAVIAESQLEVKRLINVENFPDEEEPSSN